VETAERGGREHTKESLILAAEDMDQALAAAVALRTDTSTDEAWRRALETAMAVSYMRPFTRGAWRLPDKWRPQGAAEKSLHQDLSDLRKKVYAHSDKESGRSAWMKIRKTKGDVVTVDYGSVWLAFRVEHLPAVQALCVDQRDRFLMEAAAIHVELEADATV
jgi:hypothetical protein